MNKFLKKGCEFVVVHFSFMAEFRSHILQLQRSQDNEVRKVEIEIIIVDMKMVEGRSKRERREGERDKDQT